MGSEGGEGMERVGWQIGTTKGGDPMVKAPISVMTSQKGLETVPLTLAKYHAESE
jgi:hypothetical protein